MKDTYRKIGENWVNFNPIDVLWNSDFINSDTYQRCIESGKSNIAHYVNNNKTMLSLILEGGCGNEYALRQLIYRNSYLSGCVTRLQAIGRRYYRDEVMRKLRTAIVPEYANLPVFFRSVYPIDNVAETYFREVTRDMTSQINKAATDYFYQAMRGYIQSIL
jgi:hypothetical protein